MPLPRLPGSLPVLVLAALLQSCMTTNGEIDTAACNRTLPTPKSLRPDSLVLEAATSCGILVADSGTSLHCRDSYWFQVSARDTAMALPSFEGDGVQLFQDGAPTLFPGPRYVGGDGWHCPTLTWQDQVHLEHFTPRHTLKVGAGRGLAPMRTWTLEYAFDSTKVPTLWFGEVPDGLRIACEPAPGARVTEFYFLHDGYRTPLAAKPFTTATTGTASFRAIRTLNYPVTAYGIEIDRFEACASFESGLTLAIDGRPAEAYADVCRQVEGDFREHVRDYLRRRWCRDCPRP